MGHLRLSLSIVCATALVALVAPALALAGSYSWSQPGDFSGTQGALKYGQPSWDYEGGAPPNLQALTFSSGQWGDASGDSISSSGAAVSLTAAAGRKVALIWVNPFTTSQQVTVSSTLGTSGLGCILGSLSVPSSTTVAPGSSLTATVTAGPLGACTASGVLGIQATTPPVTLTSPTSGQQFTTGQPQFQGAASTAFDASSSVSVRVYQGTAASGTPAETVQATVGSGGSYRAVPSVPLPNGTYTARAVQDDPATPPDANLSTPVTFSLNNSGPTLSLNSLGSAPLHRSKPTLTGRAGTRAQDSNTVGIVIFSGAKATGSVAGAIYGSAGSAGDFSIPVPTDLADGRYTAVAAQQGNGTVGFSNPVTFRVKVHPPNLTLSHPQPGSSVARSKVYFSGRAGEAIGDSGSVTLYLYRGERISGKSLGKRTISVSRASWSSGWGRRLGNGIYTVRVVQRDDAGHVSRVTHTFLVVSAPTTIGASVAVDRAGTVTVPISCLAPSSVFCNGTVLVLTAGTYRPVEGGPSGPLRVLFSYVQIPGGTTLAVSGVVPKPVLAVLRRLKRTTAKVTAVLTPSSGSSSTTTTTASRPLQLK